MELSKKYVKESVWDILKDIFDDVDLTNLGDEMELMGKIPLDSISFIELIVALENRFNIEIDPEYLVHEQMNSVNIIADVIILHLKKVEGKNDRCNYSSF